MELNKRAIEGGRKTHTATQEKRAGGQHRNSSVDSGGIRKQHDAPCKG